MSNETFRPLALMTSISGYSTTTGPGFSLCDMKAPRCRYMLLQVVCRFRSLMGGLKWLLMMGDRGFRHATDCRVRSLPSLDRTLRKIFVQEVQHWSIKGPE